MTNRIFSIIGLAGLVASAHPSAATLWQRTVNLERISTIQTGVYNADGGSAEIGA
ncbi:MAG: hypothetical protein R3F07_02235 [Opitutaceae bacterium]